MIKSLAYVTDLFFPAFDGEIIDRGDYLVIRSPSNPDYYWGNFVLFSKAPTRNDFSQWQDIFTREIGSPPNVVHMVFGWDSPDGELGDVEPFIKQGFRLIQNVVLETLKPTPPYRVSSEVVTRPLESDSDWAQAFDNQKACWPQEVKEPDQLTFLGKQMDRYRRMADAGLGKWFGAFLDDHLVADLGVFHDHQIGRYQSVETHPEFRRRGIAGQLVYEAGCYSLKKFSLQKLVIVADEDSAAQRLYQSLGFNPAEKQVGLEWWLDMY